MRPAISLTMFVDRGDAKEIPALASKVLYRKQNRKNRAEGCGTERGSLRVREGWEGERQVTCAWGGLSRRRLVRGKSLADKVR